jgi:DNA-binding NtrC family response regulator
MESSILLVDDDHYILDIYRYLLADFNLKIFVAHSGREALEILTANKMDFLVTDLSMPDGDGEWLIHNLPYPVKTILVTGILFDLSSVSDVDFRMMTKEDFITRAPSILKPESTYWS